jgi:large subunit ribosomal protein L32e
MIKDPKKAAKSKAKEASKPKPTKKPVSKPKKQPEKASKKTKLKKGGKGTDKPVKKPTKSKPKSKTEKDEEVEIVEDEEGEEEEEEEEPEEHVAKQKPILDKDIKLKLGIRRRQKKHRPKFRRQEWFRYKRLGKSWRKPKGLHSKMRTNKKYRPNVVRVGYGSPKAVRGLHPSGFKEILVYNVNDLKDIDPKTEAVRIGHSVGTKKRIEMEKKADELGIRVLNKGA